MGGGINIRVGGCLVTSGLRALFHSNLRHAVKAVAAFLFFSTNISGNVLPVKMGFGEVLCCIRSCAALCVTCSTLGQQAGYTPNAV